MKPGKPLTFAEINMKPTQNVNVNKVLAFGLPGNPVSCLVCFHLFVVPTIRFLSGRANSDVLRLLIFFASKVDLACLHSDCSVFFLLIFFWDESNTPQAICMLCFHV